MKVSRRAFLTDLGRGLSAAVIVACAGEVGASSTTIRSAPASSTPVTTNPPSPSSTDSPAPGPTSTEGDAGDSPSYAWERVDLDFVSAYVLVRSGEAVIIDTGVSGSEAAIDATLGRLGVGWDAVGHVIVTHEHGDHAGSARAVLDLAPSATGYAAQPDLGNIGTSRPLTPVTDGDEVEGLRIIATPGHTPGHIAVLDPGRILLTGDAINNVEATLSGPNPQFSSDMEAALESARLLSGFDYEVALFGHGEPIEQSASSRIAELTATL